MTDTFRPGPAEEPLTARPVAPVTQAAPDRASASERYAAGALQESPGISFLATLREATPKADPNFMLGDYLREKPQWVPYAEFFEDAESAAEADILAQRLEEEAKRRVMLGQGGMAGFIGELVGSMLSPSTFIPVAGAVSRIGTIGKLAAGAAIGAGIDEATLQQTQGMRTAEESAANVVGAALIGTVLGGALAMLTREEAAGAARNAVARPRGVEVPRPLPMALGDGSMGARAVNERPSDPGPLLGTLERWAEGSPLAKLQDKVLRGAGVTAPNVRNLMSDVPVVRAWQARLSTGELQFASDVAVTPGGAVDRRIAYRSRSFTDRADTILQDNYKKYRTQMDAPSRVAGNLALLKGAIPSKKKLSINEFNERVALEMQEPQADQLKEVVAAAEALRKEVYEPIFKDLVEVGIIPRELAKAIKDGKLKGAISYLNHVYKKDMLAAKPKVFEDMIARNYQRKMAEAYTQVEERTAAKNARAAGDISLLSKTDEEVKELQKEIRAMRAEFAESEAADIRSALYDARRDLNKINRTMKTDKRTNDQSVFSAGAARDYLEARIAKLQDMLDDEMRADIARDNELRRQSTVLSKSIGRLAKRQQRALNAIETLEEHGIATLRRVSKKVAKFVDEMDGLSDEAYAKGVRDLEEEMVQGINRLDDLEERAHKIREQHPEFETGPEVFAVRIQRFRREVFPGGKMTIETEAERAEALARIDDFLGAASPDAEFLKGAKEILDNGGGLDEILQKFEKFGTGDERPQKMRELVSRAISVQSAGDPDLRFAIDQLQDALEDGRVPDTSEFFPERVNNVISIHKRNGDQRLTPEEASALREMISDEEFMLEADRRSGEAVTRELKQWIAAQDLNPNKWTPQQEKSLKTLREDIAKAPLKEFGAIEEAFNKAWKLEDQRYAAIQKLNETAELLDDAIAQGPEAARSILKEWQDDTLKEIKARADSVTLRQERYRELAEKLDPVNTQKRISELEMRIKDNEGSLAEWVRTRGGYVNDDGLPDFTDGGRDYAREIRQKIQGNPTKMPGLEVMAGKRGAELSRVLDLPLNEKMEFLENDVSKLAHIYVNTVIPDIELTRSKVGVRGERIAADVMKAYEAKIAEIDATTELPAPKAMRKVTEYLGRRPQTLEEWKMAETQRMFRERDDVLKAFEGQIERLRHSRGIPNDPDSYLYRGGRSLQSLNTVSMMGNVLLSSLIDPAIAVWRYGLTNVFKYAFKPFIKGMKEYKMTKREALYYGMNELSSQARFYQIADMFEGVGRQTRGEKALDYAANKIGIVGLFSFWNQWIKTALTPVATGRLLDAIDVVVRGADHMPLEEARKIMAHMQIDEELGQRIMAQEANGGLVKSNGLWVPNTESWDDPIARDAFRTAVLSEMDAVIVTPGVERPLFTDMNMPARLLTQFQSFMWSSHVKVLMAGMQEPDRKIIEGALIASGLGAVAFYADMIARGRADELEDMGIGQWADNILVRSPFLGVLAQGQEMAEAVPGLRPYVTFSDEGSTRRYSDAPLASILGPSYGTGKRISTIASQIDDPTTATVDNAQRLLPYNNVFYLRSLFEAAGNALPVREPSER